MKFGERVDQGIYLHYWKSHALGIELTKFAWIFEFSVTACPLWFSKKYGPYYPHLWNPPPNCHFVTGKTFVVEVFWVCVSPVKASLLVDVVINVQVSLFRHHENHASPKKEGKINLKNLYLTCIVTQHFRTYFSSISSTSTIWQLFKTHLVHLRHSIRFNIFNIV